MPAGRAGGQLAMTQLAPNFEVTMYLAQATGSCIVTDSAHRWRQLLEAVLRRGAVPDGGLPELARTIAAARLHFQQEPLDVAKLGCDGTLAAHPHVLGEAATYLHYLNARGRKPNYEAQLAARFSRAGNAQSKLLRRAYLRGLEGYRPPCLHRAFAMLRSTGFYSCRAPTTTGTAFPRPISFDHSVGEKLDERPAEDGARCTIPVDAPRDSQGRLPPAARAQIPL